MDAGRNCRKIPPVTNVVYAIDKLFLGDDGKPHFLLRDPGDGRKAKLDPVTKQPTDYIQKKRHVKSVVRQQNEIIRLVPGDEAQVAVVRDMFRWRYAEQKSVWAVAERLNEKGVPAPLGGMWTVSTVKQILWNPIFTGIGVTNRTMSGALVVRHAPTPIIHPTRRKKGRRKDGKERAHIPEKLRPISEWFVLPLKELEGLLDPEVRELAKEAQWQRYKLQDERREKLKNLNAAGREHGGNRHEAGKYPLSGILHAKQGNLPMVGTSTATSKRAVRYYRTRKFASIPVRGDIRRRQLPAEPLENEVFEALAETLRDTVAHCDGLASRIRTYVEQWQAERVQHLTDVPRLEEEVKELEDKYRTLIKELGPRGKALAKSEATQLEARLDYLDKKIAAAKKGLDISPDDAADVAKTVIGQLNDLAPILIERKLASVPRLLSVFVSRMEADLETRIVELEFAIGRYGLSKERKIEEEVGMVDTGVTSGNHHTHGPAPLVLARYRLHYHSERLRNLDAKNRSLVGLRVWMTRERLPV